MARVEKVESWSIYKYFDAPSLDEAIELAKTDNELFAGFKNVLNGTAIRILKLKNPWKKVLENG